jgi:hypothetical protein
MIGTPRHVRIFIPSPPPEPVTSTAKAKMSIDDARWVSPSVGTEWMRLEREILTAVNNALNGCRK